MLFETLGFGFCLSTSALSELTPCSTNMLSFATEATGIALARHAQLARFTVWGLDVEMWFAALLPTCSSESAGFACMLFSDGSTLPVSSLLDRLPASSSLLVVLPRDSSTMINNGLEPHAAASV
jgi:hypothetical protein